MTGQTGQPDLMEQLREYATVLQRAYQEAIDLSNAPRDREMGNSAFNAGQVHSYGHALVELRGRFPELEWLLLGVEGKQE